MPTCCTWRPAGYRRGPGWLGVGEIPLPEPFGVLLIALSGSSAPRCLMLSLHSAHSEMGGVWFRIRIPYFFFLMKNNFIEAKPGDDFMMALS